MDTSPLIADQRSEPWDAGWERVTPETLTSVDMKQPRPICVGGSLPGESSAAEISMSFQLDRRHRDRKEHENTMAISLADFVEQKFVPEHVSWNA
jgi:hypothetical protein